MAEEDLQTNNNPDLDLLKEKIEIEDDCSKNVDNINVELEVLLGKSYLKFKELKKLNTGDLLKLNTKTTDLITVYANHSDNPLFFGELVINENGGLEIKIKKIIKNY